MKPLPYSWYSQGVIPSAADDAGNRAAFTPLTEEQWNAMTPEDQYNMVTDRVSSYGPSGADPIMQGAMARYRATGAKEPTLVGQHDSLRDPNAFWTDPETGFKFTDHDNFNTTPDLLSPARGIGLVLSAGALGAMYGAGGAAAGSGLGAAGESAGAGLLAGAAGGVSPSYVAGLGALGGAAAASPSYWNMTADSGGYGTDAIPDGAGLDAIQAGENVGSMTPMNPIEAGHYPNTPWGNLRLAGHDIMAGNPGNYIDRFASGVMDDPMRAMRAGNAVMSMFGGAGDQGVGGGDNGPTELGDMGWRPPTSNPDAEWMYGPDEQFDSWRQQYDRSRMPISELRRMYG